MVLSRINKAFSHTLISNHNYLFLITKGKKNEKLIKTFKNNRDQFWFRFNQTLQKGGSMKKLALVIGLLSMIATSAQAFTYSSPNVFGGFNYYNIGSFGYSTPNVFGGYNYHGNLFN